MDSWLNYHHLFYFKTIAEEGSIARAAEKLRLGQPTLSAQLRQLEESIGLQLFDRHHKKLVLTEAGRVALKYSAEIFRMGSEMLEVLKDQSSPSKMHVQLGVLDSIPKHIAYRLVKSALAVAPCKVSVLEGGLTELVLEMIEHRIDLMLTNHVPPPLEGQELITRSLVKQPVLVCGAPKFSGLKEGFPNSLNGQPFILATIHSRLRQDVDTFFRSNGITPNVVAETQDTGLQKVMGEEGEGLIPLAAPAVAPLVQAGRLVVIGELEGVAEEYFLIAANRKIVNQISSELMRSFGLD